METPRNHNDELNLWSRSSDITSILRDCPKRWVFDLVLKDERNPIWFIEGTAVHSAIEGSLRYNWDINRMMKEALKYYNKEMEAAGETLYTTTNRPVDGGEHISECVVHWWYWHQQNLEQGLEINGIQYNPTPHLIEYDVTLDIGKYGLYTRVDAVYKPLKGGDPYAIVDWKSGKSKAWARPDQLHVYYYGLTQEGTIPDVGFNGMFYHAYQDHMQVVTPETYPSHHVVEGWILHTESVKEAGVFPCMPNKFCKWCIGYDVCPAFNPDGYAQFQTEHNIRMITKEDVNE